MHIVPRGFQPTGGDNGCPHRKVQFTVGLTRAKFHDKIFKVGFKQGTRDRWSITMMEENVEM